MMTELHPEYSDTPEYRQSHRPCVPGEPRYFMRHVVTSVAGADNYCILQQRIESVRTLAGKTATLSFYAKADTNRNIAIEMVQGFSTGGSPSVQVTGIGITVCVSASNYEGRADNNLYNGIQYKFKFN